jgi:hypothetical protein
MWQAQFRHLSAKLELFTLGSLIAPFLFRLLVVVTRSTLCATFL